MLKVVPIAVGAGQGTSAACDAYRLCPFGINKRDIRHLIHRIETLLSAFWLQGHHPAASLWWCGAQI